MDDDETNIKVAGRILSKAGIRVTAMKSGGALIRYVEEKEIPDLILLDIKMPEILTIQVRHMIDLDHLKRNLADEVDKKTRENERLFLHVVSSLASAIDAKDTYTNG